MNYNNQNLNTMEKPLSYNKISIQKRQELVDLVIVNKHSIAKASKALQIKNSTAKLIVKRYRETGTFFQSKKSKISPISHQQVLTEPAYIPRQNPPETQNQWLVPNSPNNMPLFFYSSQNVRIPNIEPCLWQNYLTLLSGLQYMF